MLDARSERLGQSKARVAERLIEEGLRIEEFPGIVFRWAPPAGGPVSPVAPTCGRSHAT